jgi:hypothetical protein
MIRLTFQDGPCSVELLTQHNTRNLVVHHHRRQPHDDIRALTHRWAVTIWPTNRKHERRDIVFACFRQQLRKLFACVVLAPLVQQNNSVSRPDVLDDSLSFSRHLRVCVCNALRVGFNDNLLPLSVPPQPVSVLSRG